MKIQIKALDNLMVLDLPEKDTQILFLKLTDVALKFLLKKEVIPDEFPSLQEIQTPQSTDNLVTTGSPNLKESEAPQEIDVEYGYRGFLHIRCSQCGESSTFCSKQEITQFHCNKCGGDTKFKSPLAKVQLVCKCGKRSGYHTNHTENLIEIPCIDCGNPVAMEYNKKLGVYQTVS